jgi:hypothetical protein
MSQGLKVKFHLLLLQWQLNLYFRPHAAMQYKHTIWRLLTLKYIILSIETLYTRQSSRCFLTHFQLVLDIAQNTLYIPGNFNVPHVINDQDYE